MNQNDWDFEEEENYVLESIAYIDNILDKYN